MKKAHTKQKQVLRLRDYFLSRGGGEWVRAFGPQAEGWVFEFQQ